MKAGDRNLYFCPECTGHIVTVDRDEGTTPMFLRCRASDLCHGMMRSTMYAEEAQDKEPTHEWYEPTDEELDRYVEGLPAHVEQGVRGHVEQGGLLLREIADEEEVTP